MENVNEIENKSKIENKNDIENKSKIKNKTGIKINDEFKKNIVVLVEPEIPYNTGNIARTCVVTNTELHLVKPLGFDISSKMVKRAGLDYWYDVDLTVWENFEEFKPFLEEKAEAGYNIIYVETDAPRTIGDLKVDGPCILLFGKETKGLPKDFLNEHPERWYRIPMYSEYRSLNLSNSEAIVLYEVLRQQGYPDMH